jgi:hypothetical protein
MSSILPKGHFAVIQERPLKGSKPSIAITPNADGTYTFKVSYTVTLFPDVVGKDDQDTDLKNEQGINYAGFKKTGGEVGDDESAFCTFRNQNNGIFLSTQIIKSSGVKVNHG